MSISQNRTPLTLNLRFHDGGNINYTFGPGTVSYDGRTGLVVSFYLDMNDGSQKHVGLVPRSQVYDLLEFLTPFGLTRAAGSKFRSIAGKNVYANFGAFLLVAAGSEVVGRYLEKVKATHSSYRTLDEDHELCIQEPIYLRV